MQLVNWKLDGGTISIRIQRNVISIILSNSIVVLFTSCALSFVANFSYMYNRELHHSTLKSNFATVVCTLYLLVSVLLCPEKLCANDYMTLFKIYLYSVHLVG